MPAKSCRRSRTISRISGNSRFAKLLIEKLKGRSGTHWLARVRMKVVAGSSFASNQCAAPTALERYFTNAVAARSMLPFDSTVAQAAVAWASRINVRSRRGVIGSASTLTPSGCSASSIAEQIAGGAPMRPPSPPPLIPYSVYGDGVSTWLRARSPAAHEGSA